MTTENKVSERETGSTRARALPVSSALTLLLVNLPVGKPDAPHLAFAPPSESAFLAI